MSNTLNGNDSIGGTFKEILENEDIEISSNDYSNHDLFNDICYFLNKLKYLEDKSLVKIVWSLLLELLIVYSIWI